MPAGLAITRPAADSKVQTTNDGLTISGTLPASTVVTQLTCQLFSKSNAVTSLESSQSQCPEMGCTRAAAKFVILVYLGQHYYA
jgi:hypothetical protein